MFADSAEISIVFQKAVVFYGLPETRFLDLTLNGSYFQVIFLLSNFVVV